VNAAVLLSTCCETAKTGGVLVSKQVALYTIQSSVLLLVSAVFIV